MANKKEEIVLDEEDFVVEMTDENGNSYYYVEEMIIPVDGERYALLVAVDPDGEEHIHDEDCDCCDSDDVIIAKIILNENGEEEYIEPTDEEFEKVQEAYEQMMDEMI